VVWSARDEEYPSLWSSPVESADPDPDATEALHSSSKGSTGYCQEQDLLRTCLSAGSSWVVILLSWAATHEQPEPRLGPDPGLSPPEQQQLKPGSRGRVQCGAVQDHSLHGLQAGCCLPESVLGLPFTP
jgi:hypothetical protein